ncbi:hypothetical protein GMW39_12905 [Pectobacterium parmentieri]|nr:cadherin-like domain-containing protein [Pectobacterium parmentieri]QHQ16681.1 hypothetical protein GMW39_12905 [Pectobacterium parmentieri]
MGNNVSITIPVGQSSGTVDVATRPDDAYQQGSVPVEFSIVGTSGGNYEALDTTSTTRTTVVDNNDGTKITLEGPDTVTEGEEITIIARVELPPQGSDLVIRLTNGEIVTIPVGKTEGSVTYAARGDDNLVQGDIPQTVGIETATGGNYENLVNGDPIVTTVQDNDVPVLTVGDAGTVAEGQSARFEIALSKPVDAATTLTFTVRHGSTDADDIGTPTVTIAGQPVAVTANADGSYSVPVAAGTTDGIVVSVPTVDDGVFEGNETFELVGTLTGTTASGTPLPAGIGDTGQATISDLNSTEPQTPNPGADVPVLTVGDAGTVAEGQPARFEIALSKPVDAATTLTFTLRHGSTDADDIGTPTVTIAGQPVAVTANADGSYSVPVAAGTTDGIVVSVPTVDDGVFEGNETFELVGTLTGTTASGTPLPAGIGDTGQATISDLNSTDPQTPNPGADVPVLTVGDAGTVAEGQPARFEVALSKPVDAATTLTFTVRHGSTDADDIGTPAVTIAGQPVAVTANADGSYSVPVAAGTTDGIVVSVPTVDDGVFEGNETFELVGTLTGTTASGTPLPAGIGDTGQATISDLNSTDPQTPNPGADVPVLTVGDAGTVAEGQPARFEVALSKPVDAATTLTFTVRHGSTDADDIGTPAVTIAGQPVAVTANADGSYSVPVAAGTTDGIVVSVPTVDDGVFEGNETFELVGTLTGATASGTPLPAGIGDTGQATISDLNSTDPQTPNPGADVPVLTVGDAGTVAEGQPARFEIALSKPVDAATTLTFTVRHGSTDADDIGTPTVTIAGQPVAVTVNADGSYSVPVAAGTTDGIVVSVPTVDDGVFEGNETFELVGTLTGATASGTPLPAGIGDTGQATISDLNSTDPQTPNPGADVPVLTVGDAGTVAEGQPARFEIALSKPVDAATTLTFTVRHGSTDADDIGTPTVTIAGQPVAVTENADGSYSVPVAAGTTDGIVVSVPTVDDGVFEGNETFELVGTLTGTTASGTPLPAGIGDTGQATISDLNRGTPDNPSAGADVPVLTVGDAGTVAEGQPARFEVALSKPVDAATTLTFTVRHGSTDANDIGTPTVTIAGQPVAVTVNTDGSYSVPVAAGTTDGIVVSVPTVDDGVFEGNETFELVGTLTGATASGTPLPAGIGDTGQATISDLNSTDPQTPNPGADVPVLTVGDAGTVAEGQPARFEIALSKPVDAATTLTFTVRHGSTDADDIGTPTVTIAGQPVAVTVNADGSYSVPVAAGTTDGIVVSVPTVDDGVFEGNETFELVGTLTGATASGTPLPAGIGDTGQATISDLNRGTPDNPSAGADVPVLTVGDAGTVAEGQPARFEIALSKPVDAATTLTFTVRHGSTDADDIGTPTVTIAGQPVAVTVNADGSYSVPVAAGTTDGIVVSVPTVDDGVFEGNETFELVGTLTGATASGTPLPAGIGDTGQATISDLNSTDPQTPNLGADVPVLTVGDAGTVAEGQPARFEVALSKPVDAATTLTFTVRHGSTDADDIGTPTVTIAGQPVAVTVNADGSYSVPVAAGTTDGIVVSVPTVDDGVFEGNETFELVGTLTGATASGTPLPAGIGDTGQATISDLNSTDPQTPNLGADVPVLTVGDAGTVAEGQPARFEVALSKPVDAATTLTFTLRHGSTDADDIGTPTVTIAGQPVAVTVNADGSYSVPVAAGTTDGIVVSVPTVDDGVFEGNETFELVGTLTGATASGTPLPAGIGDTGQATISDLNSTDPQTPNPGADVPVLTVGDAGTVAEGQPARFEIALSKPVDAATTLTFTVRHGSTDADDIGTPTVTIAGQPVAVTVNADGSYSVPVAAGTTDGIVVSVPTVDDGVFEGNETFELVGTLTGATASGTPLPAGIGDTGQATISDLNSTDPQTPNPNPGADVPVLTVGDAGTVAEGQPARFEIALSKPVDAATTLTFTVRHGSTDADDIGTPTVTIAGQPVAVTANADGSYSVPVAAGTTDGIVVSVPTVDDGVFEGNETFELVGTLTGATASGTPLPAGIGDTGQATISDLNSTDPQTPNLGADVPVLTVGDAGTVAEGQPARFEIALSKPVDAATTLTFTVRHGSTDADDIGTPTVTIAGQPVAVTANADGSYSVPVAAGTTDGIVVSVPTVDDGVFEGNETFELVGTLTGTTASGTPLPAGIGDTGQATISDLNSTDPQTPNPGADVPVLTVGDAGTVAEGQPARFEIALSKPVDAATTLTFTVRHGSTDADDIGTPTVTIAGQPVAVTVNADGSYSVPVAAGTTDGIVVSVPTVDDGVFEGNETFELVGTLTGATASGTPLPAGIGDTGQATISDLNSTDPQTPNPGADVPVLTVGDAGTVAEGQPARFEIALSKPVDAATTLTFTVRHGSTDADDIGTPTVTIAGQPVAVTANADGSYSVPVAAGTTDGIVVSVPTVDDGVFEGNETFELVGTLTGTTASGTPLPAGIGDTGQATISDLNSTDPQTPNLGADVPVLTVGDAGTVAEGQPARFEIALSKPVDAATTLTFTLRHGSTDANDIGTPTVTIAGQPVAVTVNTDGSYSVPVAAGTTDGIVVSVPTVDDGVFEGNETFELVGTLTGTTASGTPLPAGIGDTGQATISDLNRGTPDNPSAGADVPVLTVGDAGTVAEGQPARFEIALSKPVDAATTLTFTVRHGSTDADDIGTPTVTIAGQPVAVTVNTDGSYSVPVAAGTTDGIVVSVPTVDDGVFEGNETFELVGTLTGTTASGTPLPAGIGDTGQATISDLNRGTPDNPSAGADVPVLTVGDAGTVAEGQPARFEIALSKPVDAATTLTFTVRHGSTDADDIGTPTVTIAGQPVAVTVNADGSYSVLVAAGTTDGIVVSVPTVDDGVFEGNETFELVGTLTGTTASGTPLPAGIGDTGQATISDLNSTDPQTPNPGADVPVLTVGDAGTVAEGQPARFEIALSKPVDAATTLTFTLRHGSTDADDIGTPTVTIAGQPVAVTVNADGSYSVPVAAGTTDGIVVSVPTVDDGVFEGNETFELVGTLTGATASGTPLPAGIGDTGQATISDLNRGTPDNPSAGADVPVLTVGDAGTVAEGQPARFEIALSKPVDAATTLTFRVRHGSTDADDIGTPTVTIAGQPVAVTVNTDGSYSVPVAAGTTDGIVVSVPTVDDGVFEGNETFELVGTLTGTTASGTPLPAGIGDTGQATISDLNHAPVTADQSIRTEEDTSVSGTITASDVDGDTLSYGVGTPPQNGTLTLDSTTGKYTYTPAANFSGSDHFTVTVADGNGGTATSTVTVGITPVADAPVVSLSSTVGATTPGSAEIIKVNGGSGKSGGFDVQDGKIVKIGSGVRVWLTEGDTAPTAANPSEQIKYYGKDNGNGNPGGSTSYADIFVVHSKSGYFYRQSDWTEAQKQYNQLDSVHGNSQSQSSNPGKDYIFVQKEEGFTYKAENSTNNRNNNFNTMDGVKVTYSDGKGHSGGFN